MLKIIDKPELPKEFFAVEVKPQLIAQAVRVFLANQRQGTQSALTRAEVARTRKKIFKQKGTGHARHGDRKSPIFVGGGIAFAPKPRDYSLDLPSKMKSLSKKEALTLKAKNNELFVVSGMDKLSGKTKELVSFLDDQKTDAKNNLMGFLIITDGNRENVWRAGRNISGLEISPVNLVNTYQLMRATKVLMMEEALAKLEEIKNEQSSRPSVTSEVSKSSKDSNNKKESVAQVKTPPTKKTTPKKVAPKTSKVVKKTK